MKVTEASQNSINPFIEPCNLAVTNAIRNEYLESARGHYLSALAGLNASKQEKTTFYNVDAFSSNEDNALDLASKAEKASMQGQLGSVTMALEMNLQAPKIVWNASVENQTMKGQFKRTLAPNTEDQFADMVGRIRAFGKETADLGSVKSVSLDSDRGKESLGRGMNDSSSLKRMLKSLKAELDNLKKEHAELKYKDEAEEYADGNSPFKLLNNSYLDESYRVKDLIVRQTFDGAACCRHGVEGLQVVGKGLKRKSGASEVSREGEKRARVSEAKEATVNGFDQRSSPRAIHASSVSTSESSARIMISEDELESSKPKGDRSDKREKGTPITPSGQHELDKCDSSPEFSIRHYVFSSRGKDISTNWPFSQKNLQLCLKRGVKNVLPPFQPIDYFHESSVEGCLSERSLPSEESSLNTGHFSNKNHLVSGTTMNKPWNQELVEGYKDSGSFPCVEDKDLGCKSSAVANIHSEVESVSTSNLPSEVSDEREPAASAANNEVPQHSAKKCRIAVKTPCSGSRNAGEDITSACTAPSEVMASKVCPVCEIFASSSNTTLNAHIDQCLSSEPIPNWTKHSRIMKPRIKPRKMRSMADICASAPRCTLEDLDRRNGTHWATNRELPLERMINNEKDSGEPRYSVNRCDDDAVYIDSQGRKIRILSKFNDTPSLSFRKNREDQKPKKQSKKGKTAKLFSSNRRRHLAKHLKYLKVTRQRMRRSSLRVMGGPNEACGAEAATPAEGVRNTGELRQALDVKYQGQKNVEVPRISRHPISCRSSLSKKKFDGINRHCKYRLRARKNLDNGSGHLDTGRIHVLKHSSSPNKSYISLERTPVSEVSHRKKTLDIPSSGPESQENEKSISVPLVFGTIDLSGDRIKENPLKSLEREVSPCSFERGPEIQAYSVDGADGTLSRSNSLLDSSHMYQHERVQSWNSNCNMLSPCLSDIHACQSSLQKNSAVEESSECRKGEMEKTCSVEKSCFMSDLERKEHTDSLAGGSMTKVQHNDAFLYSRDASKDTDVTIGRPDSVQGSYGCIRSTMRRLGKRKNITSDSFATATAGESVTSPGKSRSSDLLVVDDVSDPRSEFCHSPDKFQGPLYKAVGSVNPRQPNENPEFFYGAADGDEKLDLKGGDSALDSGEHCSNLEVDPIPIPGPPGSDLPSFSDIGSDLGNSSEDEDDVADGNITDSLLSGTSSISNFGTSDDLTAPGVETSRLTIPISDYAGQGWSGGSSQPTNVAREIYSEYPATGTVKATSMGDSSDDIMMGHSEGLSNAKFDSPDSCCSQEEAIPWSSTMRVKNAATFVDLPAGEHSEPILNRSFVESEATAFSFASRPTEEPMNLSYCNRSSTQGVKPLIAVTTLSFPRVECDSVSPAATLRLMGKDLMVVNKDNNELSRDQATGNVCMSRELLSVPQTSSGVQRSWQYGFSDGTVIPRPLLHEQVPHASSVQHFVVGSPTAVENFWSPPVQGSAGICSNKQMHSNFSLLGAAPLQR